MSIEFERDSFRPSIILSSSYGGDGRYKENSLGFGVVTNFKPLITDLPTYSGKSIYLTTLTRNQDNVLEIETVLISTGNRTLIKEIKNKYNFPLTLSYSLEVGTILEGVKFSAPERVQAKESLNLSFTVSNEFKVEGYLIITVLETNETYKIELRGNSKNFNYYDFVPYSVSQTYRWKTIESSGTTRKEFYSKSSKPKINFNYNYKVNYEYENELLNYLNSYESYEYPAWVYYLELSTLLPNSGNLVLDVELEKGKYVLLNRSTRVSENINIIRVVKSGDVYHHELEEKLKKVHSSAVLIPLFNAEYTSSNSLTKRPKTLIDITSTFNLSNQGRFIKTSHEINYLNNKPILLNYSSSWVENLTNNLNVIEMAHNKSVVEKKTYFANHTLNLDFEINKYSEWLAFEEFLYKIKGRAGEFYIVDYSSYDNSYRIIDDKTIAGNLRNPNTNGLLHRIGDKCTADYKAFEVIYNDSERIITNDVLNITNQGEIFSLLLVRLASDELTVNHLTYDKKTVSLNLELVNYE